MGLVTGVKRSLLAMLCVTALAVILVSPLVPSPPTVVGKLHVLLGGLWATVLSLAVSAAVLLAAGRFLVSALLALPGSVNTGPVFLPMRR